MLQNIYGWKSERLLSIKLIYKYHLDIYELNHMKISSKNAQERLNKAIFAHPLKY